MQTKLADICVYKNYLPLYLKGLGIDPGKRFRCLSPDHEDRHPSMGYSPKGQYVHCFSCGASYDVFDLVGMDYGLKGFRAQLDKVGELMGLPSMQTGLRYRRETQGAEREDLVDCRTMLEALRADADASLDYFLSRGINADSCDRHGLFQSGGRAVFPVWEKGVCTGWCGRSLDSSEPRYKNSVGPLGLWNGDVLDSGDGPVYVTEGIIDGLCLQQLGCRTVALCGSQNTGKLLRRCAGLESIGRMAFVLCGDPDKAGRHMNQVLGEGLTALGARWTVLPLETEDVGELYLRNRAVLAERIAYARDDVSPRPGSAAERMGLFLRRDSFVAPVPTGFGELDRLLDGGLYPGLYVIGAISSIGKTSFALQLADQVAALGRDVLFFSLEQSGEELLAKSLSRVSAMPDGRSGLTFRQMLRGEYGGRRRSLAAEYLRSAAGLFVREGEVGASEIAAETTAHRDCHGRVPVVVVDYLQILSPQDPRATDKQNTDRAVVALRRLSRSLETPVIAISSFNRENYRSTVSMEAFKESGAVEYSADVLLGLQLAGAGQKGFDVNREKLRSPRRVELVMLKNRGGVASGQVSYLYHAPYSLFREVKQPGLKTAYKENDE